MNLKDKIDEKYKISIKEKDSNSINTLRLIKSSIKDKEIDLRGKKDNFFCFTINPRNLIKFITIGYENKKD